MVKILYKGGRSHYAITLNRKSYYFTKENNHILEINDQTIINHIFSLSNRSEFEVLVGEQELPIPTQQPTQSPSLAFNTLKKKQGRPIRRK